MVLGQLGIHRQRVNLDLFVTAYTTFKCIKDLNVRAKTIKLLEENIGGHLPDLGLSKTFLDMTPKAQGVEGKIDKLNFTEFKTFMLQRIPSRK